MRNITTTLKPEIHCMALKEIKPNRQGKKRKPMEYTVIAMMIGVACCAGCITQTVTRESGMGKAGDKVLRSRTLWIWQKDFWGHE